MSEQETYWAIRIGKRPQSAPYLMLDAFTNEIGDSQPLLFNTRADAMAYKKKQGFGVVVKVTCAFK